MRQTEKCDT